VWVGVGRGGTLNGVLIYRTQKSKIFFNLMRVNPRIFLQRFLRQILKIKMYTALNSVCVSRYSCHRKHELTSNSSCTIN